MRSQTQRRHDMDKRRCCCYSSCHAGCMKSADSDTFLLLLCVPADKLVAN